jgi:RNA polymerase sigma factor (sigma-70 family)
MGATTNNDFLSDEVLVDRMVKGDQSALESLYDRHGSLLYSVALRITGDTGSAEELLQDTFFQLWRKSSQFDTARGSLVGWLLTMTRYRAISRIRRERGRTSCESHGEDAEILAEDAAPTTLELQIARQLVSAALAGLPECQREAITLAYFDGLTCEEISAQTSTPVGTVKSRLRSALKGMKTTLADTKPPTTGVLAQTPVTLETILITEQLRLRAYRKRDPQVQADSLRALAQVASSSPHQLLDFFLKMPIDLCGAQSSGLSVYDPTAPGEKVFHWTNLSGTLAKYIGGTTPRNFSPCGVTLDRKSPQLFNYPARYFQYFNKVQIPIVEALVIPLHIGPHTEGTTWIIAHDEKTKFDSEDARIMSSLAQFVGCSVHLNKAFTEKRVVE